MPLYTPLGFCLRDDTIKDPAGLCSKNTGTKTKLPECSIRAMSITGNPSTQGFPSLVFSPCSSLPTRGQKASLVIRDHGENSSRSQ